MYAIVIYVFQDSLKSIPIFRGHGVEIWLSLILWLLDFTITSIYLYYCTSCDIVIIYIQRFLVTVD